MILFYNIQEIIVVVVVALHKLSSSLLVECRQKKIYQVWASIGFDFDSVCVAAIEASSHTRSHSFEIKELLK